VQNIDLSLHFFLHSKLFNLRLIQNFYSNFMPGDRMSGKFDLVIEEIMRLFT